MPEKYKEEIEEILRRTDEVAPASPTREAEKTPVDLAQPADPARRSPRPSRGSVWRWPALSPGKILLAGLVLFLVAAVLQQGILVWVGLGVLVAAYLLFFVKPQPTSYEKRWRGRAVEERTSVWRRVKSWFQG
jgi:hypothetical protein